MQTKKRVKLTNVQIQHVYSALSYWYSFGDEACLRGYCTFSGTKPNVSVFAVVWIGYLCSCVLYPFWTYAGSEGKVEQVYFQEADLKIYFNLDWMFLI
jgi:hypothetical protein